MYFILRFTKNHLSAFRNVTMTYVTSSFPNTSKPLQYVWFITGIKFCRYEVIKKIAEAGQILPPLRNEIVLENELKKMQIIHSFKIISTTKS